MSSTLKPHLILSDRFFTAVTYVTTLHRDQVRKSTTIPYICHPLGVASLLIEAGANEDQIIAGLLHDIPEDCGGEPRLVDIELMFGAQVSEIVRGCSDSLTDSRTEKAPWPERKALHIAHLKDGSPGVLLVTAADKLHNARAIVTDLQTIGGEVWKRFNPETNQALIVGYYKQIYQILEEREVTPTLLNPLKSAIANMSGGAS